MGYSSRDFLYYKEQCGTNVASLQLIDYEEDALRMLEKSQEEREIRILVTKSQEDQMQCEIIPIKRRRHEVSEEGIQDEDHDAYKVWPAGCSRQPRYYVLKKIHLNIYIFRYCSKYV